MFEITSDDIALLNDEDLRSLVGRLCESDMKRRGISPTCVTWGGNQNAADGGVDVRVTLPSQAEPEGLIPRSKAVFQVKAEDTPPSGISSEMRPDGVVRPVIQELATQSGAYIIVSSKGSTSDSALRDRRTAMAEAVWDLANGSSLFVDFYDRKRIETWLRDHTGTTLWVRERIGKRLDGWSGYGAWSYPHESIASDYLLDGELRIRTPQQRTESGLSAIDGIQGIRDTLRNPQGIVRLVGLSGVGKTRLAQALFDDRVGARSLDPSLAVYTNVADGPNPSPVALSSELIGTHRRAVLVVDNCPPDLHYRLSELCRADGSLLSLITVEYDIREDEPEGTDVYILDVASIDLTEKLIRDRFPKLSPVDARRIADFSGGNARVAIALAGRIEKDEGVGQLPDQELFRRLFQQRQEPDEGLFRSAQALSLVYSFEGENISGDAKDELSLLGSLAGKSAPEMFAYCAELERRGLAQRRGPWRAILPHAIANRLAALALQNITPGAVDNCFRREGRERLLRSFSRRLSYLNDSKEAQSVASGWLARGGMLENLAQLNELGFALFSNIAPVSPETTLEALERAVFEKKDLATGYKRYLRILRLLAYDPVLFERCSALLIQIVGPGNVDNENNEGRRIFASLFPMYFSGTRATIDQRLAVTRSLLLSDDPKRQTLGLGALRASLESVHFGSTSEFEFGAHSRDYGWWPRSRAEVQDWFKKGLTLAEEFALSDKPVAPNAREIVAEQFRGLWSSAGMYDDLERVCRRISEKEFWPGGWIAVRQTIHYDSRGSEAAVASRLVALEVDLKPKDLLQKVRSIVLSETMLYVGVDASVDGTTDVQKSMAQVESMAQDLGRAAAADESSLGTLLPDLMTGNGGQLWQFGRGLAQEAKDPRAMWNKLIAQLGLTDKDMQNVQVLRGFLNALNEREADLAGSLLGEAVEDDLLGRWYPVLQTSVGINKDGVGRLVRSLQVRKARVGIYRSLVMGGATHAISGNDFSALLMGIASVPDGLDVAIELLYMRISYAKSQNSSTELTGIGCELMRRLRFTRKRAGEEYRLSVIAEECLVGDKGQAAVREICRNLKDAIANSQTYASYHGELLEILFRVQPRAALDALCGGEQTELESGIRILDEASQLGRHPLDKISDDDLIGWCEEAPAIRYPATAGAVTPFLLSGAPGRVQWRDIARKLLDRAPNRAAVLKLFMRKFTPGTWRGSRAAIIESNMKLLEELKMESDPALLDLIAAEKTRLGEEVSAARQTENIMERMERERDERFE